MSQETVQPAIVAQTQIQTINLENHVMAYEFKWKMPELAQSTASTGLPVGVTVENWSTRAVPSNKNMAGNYCRLEPFDLDKHSDSLFHAFAHDSDARNWTYLPYGPFPSSKEFYQWCQSACVSPDPFFYTVVDLQTEQPVGMASYLRITPEAGSIEVGHIHFSPLMQRTRASTESMYLMMHHVFDELGYRRYEWKCNALNTPSCRAAERLGFQFEGIFRQATISKNQNRDTAWFAIIDSDWPQIRDGFKEWLADENFDSQEQQLRSLTECIGAN